MVFSGIIGMAVAATILYCYLFRHSNLEFWEYVFPVAHIGEYLAGISLAYIVRLKMDKISDSSWTAILFTAAEVAALVLWIGAMYFGGDGWRGRIVDWLFPNLILLGIFTIGKGAVSKLFRLSALKALGDISFACFLIHQIIIHIYWETSGIAENSSMEGKLFSLLFCLVMTILMAKMVSKPTGARKN